MRDARGAAGQELGHTMWRCRIRPGWHLCTSLATSTPFLRGHWEHPLPAAELLCWGTAQDTEVWVHVGLPIYSFHVCGKGLFLGCSLFAAARICQQEVTYGAVGQLCSLCSPHTAGMSLVFSPPDHVGAESIQPGRLKAQGNQAAAQSSQGLPACAGVLEHWWAPATEGGLGMSTHHFLHQEPPGQHTENFYHSPSSPWLSS